MKQHTFSTIVFLLFCFFISTAYAVPNLISYQGVLNDSNGEPMSSSISMTFSIYDQESGGTALWTETQTVQVVNGLFNVQLGSVQSMSSSLFSNDGLYLGVQAGSDPEMSPRQRITTGPYTHHAERVSYATLPIGIIMPWAKNIDGVPALSELWMECNGQEVTDPESPLNGQSLPDLNGGNRFLRGASTSGGTGGKQFQDLNHSHSWGDVSFDRHNDTDAVTSISKSTTLGSVDNRPPYYNVVWIMKVK